MSRNLNQIEIETDGPYKHPTFDNSTCSTDGQITVYFRDLLPALLKYIRQADVVTGCVAWLTHPEIISALAKCNRGAAIVVQKEDFLRPDTHANDKWKSTLHSAYQSIGNRLCRSSFPHLSNLSVCGDPTLHGVRCVGNHNRDRDPAFPRMHNKFLVFWKLFTSTNDEPIDLEEDPSSPDFDQNLEPEKQEIYRPYAVWTGSFNLTKNATLSLENALYVLDPIIVGAYAEEWRQITSISEPLNWTSDWCAPEWRIGT